jgi:hypothetical protein
MSNQQIRRPGSQAPPATRTRPAAPTTLPTKIRAQLLAREATRADMVSAGSANELVVIGKIRGIDVHSSKLTAHLLTLRAFGQLAHFWHTLVKVVALGPVFSGGSSHGAPQESRFERTTAASHGAYAIELDEAVTTTGVSGPCTRLGGRERA